MQKLSFQASHIAECCKRSMESKPSVVLFIGMAGSGKTTLMHRAVIDVVYICQRCLHLPLNHTCNMLTQDEIFRYLLANWDCKLMSVNNSECLFEVREIKIETELLNVAKAAFFKGHPFGGAQEACLHHQFGPGGPPHSLWAMCSEPYICQPCNQRRFFTHLHFARRSTNWDEKCRSSFLSASIVLSSNVEF